jgi:signal transduction histidine kinase
VDVLDGDRLAAGGGDGAALSGKVIRALLIDDAEVEFLWLERMLQRGPRPHRALDWAGRYADALAAIERDHHDLYFVDFRLGPDSGLDLIRHARQRGVLKPIIMLTGHGSESVDQAATEAGANDYLVKGEFDHVLLERTIRYATRNAAAVAELDRRLAESEAATCELKLQTARRAVAEAELSGVLRRIVTDQEAERHRIARELHDSLGQSLTLLQLGLEVISRAGPSAGDFAGQVASLRDLAGRMSGDVSRLAWKIRPTALDDLGLQAAIRQLPEDWGRRCKLAFDLHLALDDRRLPPDVETTLYRVLQEAITNVVRHACAHRIGIILESTASEVRLIVEDDGCGLPANEASAAGGPVRRLGLLGMRERLSLVCGSLEVESTPGQGTTLFARVPL